ncbi:STAS domain-containing protein [bacterium]|nr:STAS domain-containing protein [bacterium]
MTYEITNPPPDLAVLVKGRLDTLTSPKLESELEPSIAKASSLVLDLAGVDYLSSAGLRLLLTLQKRFKREGGSFKLRNIQPGVMEILRMTGFLKILSVE